MAWPTCVIVFLFLLQDYLQQQITHSQASQREGQIDFTKQIKSKFFVYI